MSICKHCKKEIEQGDKANNYMANHSRWCESNPKRKDGSYSKKGDKNPMFGKNAWNKGLTKETNDILKNRGESLSKKYISGKLIPANKGKIKTDKEKEVDRQAALKSNHQRVCKKTVNYTCLDGSIVKLDSSWEVKLAKLFDKEKIIWERPNPLKWLDKDGVLHNYFPDFFLPDFNVYLDPKNDWVIKTQEEKLKCLEEQYDNIFILREQELNMNSILSKISI